MASVGIALAWFGYAVFYYGYNQLTGGNDSFRALIWPGAYTPVPRDGPRAGPDPLGGVGGRSPQFDPSTGKAIPGTGVAPGGGTGPGGTGYGTGDAPGYNSDPYKPGGPLMQT